MRSSIPFAVALAILSAPALSLTEPPIQGPQDAACREEARAKVFSTPDPQHVGLFETGRRIYQSCMAAAGKPPRARPAR